MQWQRKKPPPVGKKKLNGIVEAKTDSISYLFYKYFITENFKRKGKILLPLQNKVKMDGNERFNITSVIINYN